MTINLLTELYKKWTEDITKDVIEEVEDIKVYLRSIEDSLRILREIKQKIKG
jgi:hypothetical protein